MTGIAAFQGVEGAFAEEAAFTALGEGAKTLPCPKLDDVFDRVAHGQAAWGVVPVENTLAGAVVASYDLLGARDVRIVGEVVIRISHALIAAPGVALADVRRVHSHPIALAQCEGLFRAHPEMTPIAAYNTAAAVRDVVQRNARDEAAIGSARAAHLYGGAILASGIEDAPENFTRFHVFALAGAEPPAAAWSSQKKTSLVFVLAHRPGTLAKALDAFSARAIDLTKIESRPLKGRPFEYAFYVDVAGAASDPATAAAIEALGEVAQTVKVLGTYGTLGERM